MKKLLLTTLFVLFNAQANAAIVEIYFLDLMDDQRGFCIDIRGHKSKAKIDSGLQAHTCYSYQGSIAVDQGFASLKLDKNHSKFDATDAVAIAICHYFMYKPGMPTTENYGSWKSFISKNPDKLK